MDGGASWMTCHLTLDLTLYLGPVTGLYHTIYYDSSGGASIDDRGFVLYQHPFNTLSKAPVSRSAIDCVFPAVCVCAVTCI